MSHQYHALAFVCRAQPFHNAHLATCLYALTLSDKLVIVVGSDNQPRDTENPFTSMERHDMISTSLRDAGVDMLRVKIVYVENTVYNDTLWAINVAKLVEEGMGPSANIGIIGHDKDESTFYLNIFPQWGKPVEAPFVEILDATTIRNIYFSKKNNLAFFKAVIPQACFAFLQRFQETDNYKVICAEAEYIENYRKPYSGLPYPVSFNTGDAVVFKSSHVLMIRRRSHPGKGSLAFPGGFLNANSDKSLLDCAIRELYEETKIKVPEKIIRGSIVEEKTFAAINRSRRGRIITTAQCIVLDDSVPGLPKVKGSDDAESAIWIPINQVKRIQCFEDHFDILNYFVGRIANS